MDWSLGGALATVTNTQKAYLAADTAPQYAYREFFDLDTNIGNGDSMELITWQPTDPALTSAQGIGAYYAGDSGSGGASRRGGSWSSSTNAGAFALSVDDSSAGTNTYIGFRCVFRP